MNSEAPTAQWRSHHHSGWIVKKMQESNFASIANSNNEFS